MDGGHCSSDQRKDSRDVQLLFGPLSFGDVVENDGDLPAFRLSGSPTLKA